MKILATKQMRVECTKEGATLVFFTDTAGVMRQRALYTGDAMTVGYEALIEASDAVEAAIHGALALEGEYLGGKADASRTK